MILLTVCVAVPVFGIPKNNVESSERKLLYFDDFEAKTIKWLGTGSGSVSLSDYMAFSGSGSMNITSKAWDLEEALRQIGSPEYPLPDAILEFRFSIPYQNLNCFVFGLEYCSANRGIWYRSAIILPQGKYENGSGSWIPMDDYSMNLDLTDNYSIWHYASLTVDLNNGKYIQVVIDDYVFDLDSLGYQLYDRTLEGNPVLWGSFYPYFYSFGMAGSCSVLVDDVALYLEISE